MNHGAKETEAIKKQLREEKESQGKHKEEKQSEDHGSINPRSVLKHYLTSRFKQIAIDSLFYSSASQAPASWPLKVAKNDVYGSSAKILTCGNRGLVLNMLLKSRYW